MQRIMGRHIRLIFSLRNSSQVASTAARAVSDTKKIDLEQPRKETAGTGIKSKNVNGNEDIN